MSVTHYEAKLLEVKPAVLRYQFTVDFHGESPSYGMFEVCTTDWKYEILEAQAEPDITACVSGLVAKLRRLLRENAQPPESFRLIA